MYLKHYNKLIEEKKVLEDKLFNLSIKKETVLDINKEFDNFLKTILTNKNFISNLISKITLSEDKEIVIYFNIKNCNL